MALTGQRYEALTDALVAAFPDQESLDMMVRFKLGRPLNTIAPAGTLDTVVYKLLVWAESRDTVEDLIVGALNRNPDNPKLRAVAEQWKLDEGSGDFERIVIKSVPLAEVESWRASMMACERTVCRVEVEPPGKIGVGIGIPGKTDVGTGFLFHPNFAITNYHVIDEILKAGFRPNEVVLRFDYKQRAYGKTVQNGKEYRLAAPNWLADESPVKDLDYAVLEVQGHPGEERVAGQPDSPLRGWLTPHSYEFKPGDPLHIIQHPEATPLKFAPGSVVSVDALATASAIQ